MPMIVSWRIAGLRTPPGRRKPIGRWPPTATSRRPSTRRLTPPRCTLLTGRTSSIPTPARPSRPAANITTSGCPRMEARSSRPTITPSIPTAWSTRSARAGRNWFRSNRAPRGFNVTPFLGILFPAVSSGCRFEVAGALTGTCEPSGMKKYIRNLLDDLKKKQPPPPVVPQDLENQELSNDPAERVKQLDYQAQEDEERETLE